MPCKLTRLERETIIRYNEAEDFAEFDTRIKRDQKKLERDGFEPIRIIADYKRYQTPKRYARRWGFPRKVTDKQRESASERMKKYNALKKSNEGVE